MNSNNIISSRAYLAEITKEANRRSDKEEMERFVDKNVAILEIINKKLISSANCGYTTLNIYSSDHGLSYEDTLLLERLLIERGYEATVHPVYDDNNGEVDYWIMTEWSCEEVE